MAEVRKEHFSQIFILNYYNFYYLLPLELIFYPFLVPYWTSLELFAHIDAYDMYVIYQLGLPFYILTIENVITFEMASIIFHFT